MTDITIDNIIKGTDLRNSLITLKNALEDDSRLTNTQLYNALKRALHDEDPKVRKNAAIIIGRYRKSEVRTLLIQGYENETTEFVKEGYLRGLLYQDCKPVIGTLRRFQQDLAESGADAKHVQAQLKILNPLILSNTAHKKKVVRLLHNPVDVVLTTLPYYQFTLFEYVLHLKYKPVGQGVLVRTNSLYDLMPIRNYHELIIPLSGCVKMPMDDADVIVEKIKASNLRDILSKLFDTPDSFYYRLTDRTHQKHPKLVSDVIRGLTEAYPGFLLNVLTGHEIEIQLREVVKGTVNAYLTLPCMNNPRFEYRRDIIANAMHPYVAATLMELAKPYMTDNASVLDPFCGSGITLIERCMIKPVRFALGLDIYGRGLEAAKRNTKAANLNIHYINKDALRFVNNELFDEIFTDMPTYAQMRDKEALDRLYERFFKRIVKQVKPGGYVFIYTSEIGQIQKNLRLQSGALTLVEHYDIPRVKNMFYFFIIKVQ